MSAKFDPKNFKDISEEDEYLWELLSAYIDGETTPAESSIVEAHLRSDAAYAQDFAFLKAAARQVIQIGEVTPPTELRDAIFAATIYKPTLSRRFAQALGQLQSVISPRYALPMGTLAAGILAAFLFVPKTADNRPSDTNTTPQTVVVAPKTEPVKTLKAVEPILPKGTQAAPTIAKNNEQPKLALPTQPEINFAKMLIEPAVRTEMKPVVAKKLVMQKFVSAQTSNSKKTLNNMPKLTPVGDKTEMPMTTEDDMFSEFSLKPNMDRENQRTIAQNDPPTEPLPNEDVTPNSADTTPAPNVVPSINAEAPTRTFRVRSTRTLPDSRRIATAAQFRTEQSEFQQGISRNTMLAMQRDELSGSTVTRF